MNSIFSTPKRPKWFDRQMIGAGDLRDEQLWQDAQLNRMRQYALGWGVVAGFELEYNQGNLSISSGYGLTPFGSEIHLPKEHVWPAFHKDLMKKCAPDWVADCENIDLIDTSEVEPVVAWLVARPDTYESCPRPTVPEGCAHPSNHLEMSRIVTGFRLEIICELPDGYAPAEKNCDALKALLEVGDVAMPSTPEEDFLPIGRLQFNPVTIDEIHTEGRQRLLPVSQIQSMLACCCKVSAVEPDPDPDPVPPTETNPWDNLPDATIGDIFTHWDPMFPRGANDNDLTIKEIWESAPRGRAKRKILERYELYKSYVAASLLVNQNEFGNYQNEKFNLLYNRWQSLSRVDFYARYRVNTNRVSSDLAGTFGSPKVMLSPSKPKLAPVDSLTLHNLHIGNFNPKNALKHYGDVKVSELLNWSSAKFTHEARRKEIGPLAFLHWMQQRLQSMI